MQLEREQGRSATAIAVGATPPDSATVRTSAALSAVAAAVMPDTTAVAVAEWSAGISAAYPESLLEVTPMPVPTMATAADIAQAVRASLATPRRLALAGAEDTSVSVAAEVATAATAAGLDASGVDEATLTMLAMEALAVSRRQVVVEVGDLRQLLCERELLTAELRQRYAHEAQGWEERLQGMERVAAQSKAVSCPQRLEASQTGRLLCHRRYRLSWLTICGVADFVCCVEIRRTSSRCAGRRARSP
jgi:hypothetical protein